MTHIVAADLGWPLAAEHVMRHAVGGLIDRVRAPIRVVAQQGRLVFVGAAVSGVDEAVYVLNEAEIGPLRASVGPRPSPGDDGNWLCLHEP